jgi:hypothetical protein
VLTRRATQAAAPDGGYGGADVLAVVAGKANDELPYTKTVAVHVRACGPRMGM